MDEHAAVAQDRVEAEAVWRGDLQHIERARHEHENDEEEAQNRRHDPGGVRGEPEAERGAGHQSGAPEQAEDQRPVKERALLPTIECRRHQGDRRRKIAVLGDICEREIVGEQRRLE